ncbi:adenylate/guanylate cyclase domain-containing protein [Azovibrio restrictus]|uniref:adenylate/guanylate cyclase domain-containing protein n=1 Tax=Azovibrio restrictus TaxID=146938 RepID=UPI0026E9CF6B|nr:adenylate/guanylate cyclase domain-containing protein [Azovibrio restrictus]
MALIKLDARNLLLMLQGLAMAWLAALHYWQPWQGLDSRLGDIFLRQEARSRIPPPEIVLIDIDQNSLDDPEMLDLAGNWPWPRAIHGELLHFLARQGPRAVIFDLIFSEPDRFRPESDRVFEEALRRHPAYLPLVVTEGEPSRLAQLPPILGARATDEANPNAGLPLLAPKALSPEVWRTGLINFLQDEDGVGRRYWLHFPHEGWVLPSMPARVARETGVAVPEGADLHLHFYGAPFTRISYSRIFLESLKQSPRDLPDLRDRIVIIGAAAPGLHDLRPTPLSATTPGPAILATALANLMHGDYLRPVSPLASLGLGLLLILGLSRATYLQVSPLRQGGWLLLATLASLYLAWILLGQNLLWQPFSTLLSAWLFFALCALGAYVRERLQREHTVRMFGRFLDPRVVEAVTEGGVLATAQEGSSRDITVLFSDIRGFTTLSETRPPEEIVRLLNRYFDTQVEAIFQEGGTLDKFIGDAIMAFWGAPMASATHAAQAVRAALGMQERLERFKHELGEAGTHFDIGIGIHTGPAVVGFLGSSQRLDYTAIGDTVNLASRIEGLTKGVARILVSEATRDACMAQAPGEFIFIDHGEAKVKGRERPVRLFEPRSTP